jgi:predicted TIM-barrel fold metal-dependent hydrolase
LCRETNDYLLESAAKHPKRLVAFCSVQLAHAESAIAEVDRCVRGGARGIGEIRSDMQGFDLADGKRLSSVVQAIVEHGICFLTHCSEPVGHTYPGKGSVNPQVLWGFISNFPQLKVVCAHWGGGLPFYGLMPEVGRALKNVWFDTAASPYLYRPQVFSSVAAIVGDEKILFGSDYPVLDQRRVVRDLDAGGLDHGARERILGENGARLLGLV